MPVYSASLSDKAIEAPGVGEFIESMVNHHPYVLAINEGKYQAAAEFDIAKSNFDPFIEQKTKSRLSGYYDGTSLAQRFTNPIEDFNGELFAEYRISNGDFPAYEGEYETLSGGEISAGVSIALLKNREIDKRRTELKNAGLATSQWQAHATHLLNDFIYKGVSEYIAWYESALQVEAVNELLITAVEREKALVTRVEKGDLANIVLIEFKSNVLQQQLLLTELKQKRDSHAQMLSFYWRSPMGEMQGWEGRYPPNNINWPFSVNFAELSNLRNALKVHPELDVMKLERQVVKNKTRLTDNALLPKLDLNASVARDVGAGLNSLEGTETKLGLSFSYPIGNRRDTAERTQLLSKQRELEYKLSSTEQILTQRFEQALVYWGQAKDILALQGENTALANRLSKVEKTRFDAGEGDMFTLNARAQNEIKARMKEIKARVDVLKAELLLYKEAAKLNTES
ncbi:TolC family protein [Alteromonas sp. D210916BOD_24]